MTDKKRRLPILGQPEHHEHPPSGALTPPAELEREAIARVQSTRRDFLRAAATGAVAVAASGCAGDGWEDVVRQHYQRLGPDELEIVLRRLEERAEAQHGVAVNIADPPPIEGVEFGYALNLSACTGCRQCEYACAAENNTSRDPEIHYIQVLELDAGTFDLERGDAGYEGSVPASGKVYMPVSCMQCRNAPCVSACPVGATWTDPDGIVVVDYDWCIGCRYCQVACPYGARHFNFAEPSIRPSEINPDQGYLSNRVRPRGAMEKCHFCLHRTRLGLLPACQEACPVGARHFGNLLDPESEVRRILATKRVYVLREDLGTEPRFFYFFD